MKMKPFFTKTFFLAVLLAIVAVYASLELMLNYLLVETYEESALTLFSESQDRVVQIGFFGRLLSGFGLTLLVFGIIEGALKLVRLYGHLPIAGKKSRAFGYLARPFAFVGIWAVLIVSIEVFVDVAAAKSSPEAKLAATRALIFREAYRDGQIGFESAPQMDAFLEDEINRKISIALIPSLAYFSESFKNQIRDQLENIVANNVEQNRQKDYLQTVPAILTTIEQFARREVAAYGTFEKVMTAANRKLESGAVEAEYQDVMKSMAAERRGLWKIFSDERDPKSMKELANNASVKIYEEGFDYRKRMKRCKKKKDKECIESEYKRHRVFIENLGLNWVSWEYWNEVSFLQFLGSWLTLPVAYTSCIAESVGKAVAGSDSTECEATKKAVANALVQALDQRKNFLKNKYGLPLDAREPEFQKSDYVARALGQKMTALGYALGETWEARDSGRLLKLIETRFKNAKAEALRQYRSQSRFDFEYGTFSDAQELVKHPSMRRYYREQLGEYYFDDYLPLKGGTWLGEAAFYHAWSATTPTSLEYVKLFSDEATGAFHAGGAFHDLGKDSVAFAIIPPVSIVLSALAVFGLFLKLINKFVFSVVPSTRNALTVITVILLFIAAIATSKAAMLLEQENTGAGVSRSLLSGSDDQSLGDKAVALGFGLALDLERAVYLVARTQSHDANRILQWLNTEGMRGIIDKEKQLRYRISGLLLRDSTFDFSVSVYDKESRMAYSLALGLTEDNQINRVKIPNLLSDTDFGNFLEIPLFFRPDYQSLLLESVMNAPDVEFWLDIHSGRLIRESAIERIERAILQRFEGKANENFPILFEGKPVTQGNLLAFRADASGAYKCIHMESIDYRLLQQTIRAAIDGDGTMTNCRIEL